MSPKQKIVIAALQLRQPATTEELLSLPCMDYYANGAKHLGALLSNMVKRGMIERVKPGLFQLPTRKPESQNFQLH